MGIITIPTETSGDFARLYTIMHIKTLGIVPNTASTPEVLTIIILYTYYHYYYLLISHKQYLRHCTGCWTLYHTFSHLFLSANL